MEQICECGDSEQLHIDGQEQCFVVGCGCGEFAEREERVLPVACACHA